MERYAPTLLDLAPRDMVSRAITTEILEGNGMEGTKEIDDYVLLDATHLGKDVVAQKIPDIADFCRTYLGIDPAEAPIPIQPTAHYAMGGIPTDTYGRVTTDGNNIIAGLYAAGECACVSVHGANRLGTNSLLELVVFGRRAGRHIAQFVADAEGVRERDVGARVEEHLAELRAGKTAPPALLNTMYERMQRCMMRDVGVYRDAKAMQHAIDEIAELRHDFRGVSIHDQARVHNQEFIAALELRNLLDIAYVTAYSAHHRTESRGAHSRRDYPDRNDDEWLKHSLCSLDNGRLTMGYRPVNISIWKPKPRVY